MKTRLAIPSLALLTAVAIAGCGGGGTETGATTVTGGESGTASEPQTAEERVAALDPVATRMKEAWDTLGDGCDVADTSDAEAQRACATSTIEDLVASPAPLQAAYAPFAATGVADCRFAAESAIRTIHTFVAEGRDLQDEIADTSGDSLSAAVTSFTETMTARVGADYDAVVIRCGVVDTSTVGG